MLEMNPNYKYCKQLAGTWKDPQSTCEVILTSAAEITINYAGCQLKRGYELTYTGNMMPIGSNNPGMMGFMGMFMTAGSGSMRMINGTHPDEDIRLHLEGVTINEGDKERFRIGEFWHSFSDILFLELIDISTGSKTEIQLKRVAAEGRKPVREGEYQCECGQIFTGKFCPNCGARRQEKENFQCECGFNGPVSNFCPNCGKPYPGLKVNGVSIARTEEEKRADDSIAIPAPEPLAGWTCPKCGSEKEIDLKCSKCGAEIEHFVLFVLSEYSSSLPPRTSVIRVYKFDDTRLILEKDDMLRFIPTSVLEPAYEIIKEYEIDKWEEYKGCITGLMGGSQSVSYFDGDQLVGTSTDHMLKAGQAYSALRHLFLGASM
ncbi:MAG: hypothetical protein K6E85_12605 [Lachnospiraceae bacterium]|nr:hypothetical protein [Lachnospiraceae bacterium]